MRPPPARPPERGVRGAQPNGKRKKVGSGGQRPPGIILVFRMILILVGATACLSYSEYNIGEAYGAVRKPPTFVLFIVLEVFEASDTGAP